jgi:hypothetical protein
MIQGGRHVYDIEIFISYRDVLVIENKREVLGNEHSKKKRQVGGSIQVLHNPHRHYLFEFYPPTL